MKLTFVLRNKKNELKLSTKTIDGFMERIKKDTKDGAVAHRREALRLKDHIESLVEVGGTRSTVAQTHGEGVRTVAAAIGQIHDLLPETGTHTRLPLQRPRHCGNIDAQHPGYVTLRNTTLHERFQMTVQNYYILLSIITQQ